MAEQNISVRWIDIMRYSVILNDYIQIDNVSLFSILTLSECDATPYPNGKGKITVLNNLFARDYLCLVIVLGEGSIKHANKLEAAKSFSIVIYW